MLIIFPSLHFLFQPYSFNESVKGFNLPQAAAIVNTLFPRSQKLQLLPILCLYHLLLPLVETESLWRKVLPGLVDLPKVQLAASPFASSADWHWRKVWPGSLRWTWPKCSQQESLKSLKSLKSWKVWKVEKFDKFDRDPRRGLGQSAAMRDSYNLRLTSQAWPLTSTCRGFRTLSTFWNKTFAM